MEVNRFAYDHVLSKKFAFDVVAVLLVTTLSLSCSCVENDALAILIQSRIEIGGGK